MKKNFAPLYPLPKHVRDGLGFRTAWMCQNQPNDPTDANFTFKDLPKMARDAKEHGLDEIVLFAWNQGFVLPLPPPYPHLGSQADMDRAVAECRKLGVNIVPFISVLQANEQTASRYGVRVVDNNGWTFHTELIPEWNPPYAHGFSCIPVPIDNPLWQKDVLAGARHLIDHGIMSLGWDQFCSVPTTPNINTLAVQIRKLAKAKDPESTFCGEELNNFEVDSRPARLHLGLGGSGPRLPSAHKFVPGAAGQRVRHFIPHGRKASVCRQPIYQCHAAQEELGEWFRLHRELAELRRTR